MSWRSISRSLAALHSTGSPTITGTICEGDWRVGIERSASAALRQATARPCASRSIDDALRWRTEAVAAAMIGGGRAVVKMKPGAVERTKSTIVRLAAI